MNEPQMTKIRLFGIPLIMPYIKKYIPRIIFMIFLGMVSSLIDAVSPLFNRYALNHFVAESTLEGLPAFILIYVGVLIVYVLANFICTYKSGQVEMSVDRDLRNEAFSHLQKLSFSYYNQNSVGYIHARVMSDTGKIGLMVSWRLMDIIWNGAYILFVFVMMFILNVRLALAVGVLIIPVTFIVMFFQKRLVAINRQIREMNSVITGDLNEGVTGAVEIKNLAIEDKMRDDFKKDTEHMRHISVRGARYSALFTSSVTMMSSVALAWFFGEAG